MRLSGDIPRDFAHARRLNWTRTQSFRAGLLALHRLMLARSIVTFLYHACDENALSAMVSDLQEPSRTGSP